MVPKLDISCCLLLSWFQVLSLQYKTRTLYHIDSDPSLKMELVDINPSEVVFREELFRSQYSLIYLTTIRGITCVMKLVGLFWISKLSRLLKISPFSWYSFITILQKEQKLSAMAGKQVNIFVNPPHISEWKHTVSAIEASCPSFMELWNISTQIYIYLILICFEMTQAFQMQYS